MAMTMTMSAARHMTAGVMDLADLSRLVEVDTGKVPSRKVLSDHRARFRRHGAGWIDAERDKLQRWVAENPGRKREADRRWRNNNPAKKLLGACRGSAKRRGLECTLTVDDIEPLLYSMRCAVSGLPLSLEHDGGSARNPWTPSVDRIDCTRGYVPGNVRVVCWAFNMMRADWSDEVVFALAKALAARAP